MLNCINLPHSSVVTVIIQSIHWRQAMQFCNDPYCKEGGETPLRKLIKKMPGECHTGKIDLFSCYLTDNVLCSASVECPA